MNEHEKLLKPCGCGNKPYIINPPGFTRNAFGNRTRFYAYIKCSCGIKTDSIWASNQISADYKAIGIWNKAMKTTMKTTNGGSNK